MAMRLLPCCKFLIALLSVDVRSNIVAIVPTINIKIDKNNISGTPFVPLPLLVAKNSLCRPKETLCLFEDGIALLHDSLLFLFPVFSW